MIAPEIFAYIENHTSPEPAHLARLRRETYLKVLYPRMLSGHVQGRFLAMVSAMIQPRHILEIGTFTGYSCICLAEGLHPEGRITTIECDPELNSYIQKGIEEADIASRVDLRFGTALDILPELEGPFDLVFIDADKQNYPAYFEAVLPRLRVGGMILADNVLWGGSIVDLDSKSKEVTGLRAFNDLVMREERVDQVILPLRDGITMIRKKM